MFHYNDYRSNVNKLKYHFYAIADLYLDKNVPKGSFEGKWSAHIIYIIYLHLPIISISTQELITRIKPFYFKNKNAEDRGVSAKTYCLGRKKIGFYF